MKIKLNITWDNGDKSQIVNLAELDEKDYLIVEDKWGRRWILMPVNNIHIVQPFIISPLPD